MSRSARTVDAHIYVDGEDVVPEVHAVLDRWPTSPITCAPASGKDTPANASGMWSTSVSAGLILGPVDGL